MEELIKNLVGCSKAIQDSLSKVDWESTCISELAVYMKALELMANDYSFNSDGKALAIYYLQKARESLTPIDTLHSLE